MLRISLSALEKCKRQEKREFYKNLLEMMWDQTSLHQKILDIQNTLEIQLFQTKKRTLRTQLDTLDFRADRNFR